MQLKRQLHFLQKLTKCMCIMYHISSVIYYKKETSINQQERISNRILKNRQKSCRHVTWVGTNDTIYDYIVISH